jgi:hypothetical protein
VDDPSIDSMSFAAIDPFGSIEQHFADVQPLPPDVSFSGATNAGALPVAFPGIDNGFYSRDPVTLRSVFSFYDGFSFTTVVWDGSLVTDYLSISDPIHALLTTGELYHRGGEEDTVYGFDGRKEYEFPTGALRLAYETFDNPLGPGVPTLYYTLVYWESGGGDDELYIRVYALRTDDLNKLD